VDGVLLMFAEAPPDVGGDAANWRVRRWDQDPRQTSTSGAIEIVPGEWIAVEEGIEVRFSSGAYRAGDYWQTAARVATSAIEWPGDAAGLPLDQPPKGVAHHYAPLFLFKATATAPFVEIVEDCRRRAALLPCG
jgi:hypothetical protein